MKGEDEYRLTVYSSLKSLKYPLMVNLESSKASETSCPEIDNIKNKGDLKLCNSLLLIMFLVCVSPKFALKLNLDRWQSYFTSSGSHYCSTWLPGKPSAILFFFPLSKLKVPDAFKCV
jgi:hypothetical protein